MAIAFSVLAMCSTGCRRHPVFLDKLETAVLIDVEHLDESIYNSVLSGYEIRTSIPVKVWIRAVESVDYKKPKSAIFATINLVDADGSAVDAEAFRFSRGELQSGSSGVSDQHSELTVLNPGVYRIKATYNDKRGISTSYSRPIIAKGK